jgi:hypothetical protein
LCRNWSPYPRRRPPEPNRGDFWDPGSFPAPSEPDAAGTRPSGALPSHGPLNFTRGPPSRHATATRAALDQAAHPHMNQKISICKIVLGISRRGPILVDHPGLSPPHPPPDRGCPPCRVTGRPRAGLDMTEAGDARADLSVTSPGSMAVASNPRNATDSPDVSPGTQGRLASRIGRPERRIKKSAGPAPPGVCRGRQRSHDDPPDPRAPDGCGRGRLSS